MAKRKKNRKAVLVTSCVMAALIVASSSFAWFTSKDEVTNRLTATADYGVTLVEDFKPPEDMTPGQKVNKDVSTVNTGSVDAFVRLSIGNDIKMSRLSNKALTTTNTVVGTTVYKKADGTVDTQDMKDATTSADMADGETYLYDLKVFGDPSTTVSTPTGFELVKLDPIESDSNDGSKNANEVTTLMAGGQVVVAASKAVAPAEQSVRSGDDVNGADKIAIIYKMSSSVSEINDIFVEKDGTNYYKLVKDQNGLYKRESGTPLDLSGKSYTIAIETLAHDYSGMGEYRPANTGLYLFKRNNNTTPEYSGFYYNKTANEFYALETKDENLSAYVNGSVTMTDVDATDASAGSIVTAVSDIKLRTIHKDIKSSDGTWAISFVKSDASTAASADLSDAKFMKVQFTPSDIGAEPVVFDVELVDGWQTNWTYVADGTLNSDTSKLGYFYYNGKLESGETSEKLIDSVTLNASMDKSNYLDLVYDLNVVLDSVQVTKDQYGNETMDAAAGWATHSIDYGNAAGVTTNGDGVIHGVEWSAT